MRRAAALFVMLACAGGCSLVVSTSGLSGGGEPAALEGGPDVADGASVVDSPSEGAASDGGRDAPDAASPCTSQHLFCDDFDTGGSSPNGRWSSIVESAEPLTLDTSMFLSPPRALRASVAPGAGVRISELRKVLSPTSSKSTLDVDLFITGPTGGSFVEVDPLGVSLTPAPPGFTEHGIAVAIYPSKTVLQYHRTAGGAATAVESAFTLPTSRWVHLTLTVDYASGSPLGTIAVDGVQGAQVVLSGAAPTSLGVEVGVIYTSSADTNFSVVTDNVVVD